MFKSIFSKFFLLTISLILISELLKSFLHFDTLFYNSLSEQLTSEEIENFIGLQKKWGWIGHFTIAILLLVKTFLISTFIYIGLFFSNKDLKLKLIWKIVLKAEFIFLLVPLFKIIWFYFFQINYTLEDVQYFYPFSALNIIGYENLEPWYIYPLQTLNLFELGYWLYLGYLIGKETETNMDKGFKIVASSYGPALLLWVVTIMFFTLNYS